MSGKINQLPTLVKTKLPDSDCLQCGTKLNAAAGEIAPKAGDLTACIECGAVMTYDDDMTLRGFTDAEMDELSNDRSLMDGLARTVRNIHLMKVRDN